MELLDYILHFGDVLSTVDHRRLLEICRGIEFPEYKIGYDREACMICVVTGVRYCYLKTMMNCII